MTDFHVYVSYLTEVDAAGYVLTPTSFYTKYNSFEHIISKTSTEE